MYYGTMKIEKSELNDQNPWEEILSSTAFAFKSTYHMTLGAVPSSISVPNKICSYQ